jgi:chaperone required for assembly of F1-ATPase
MRRFYKNATQRAGEGGHEILLDDRPVKTPARQPLRVPTAALAEAIAAEWNAQGDKVVPRSMPLTGLANAAVDRIAPDPSIFVQSLAVFGESDLLCYRAEAPDTLTALQSERWDPLLAWARRRFDVDFETICGVIHRPQPEATLVQLRQALAARDPFELAALSPLVTIGGSLIIALALAEGAIDLDTAWAAATLDEAWQAEHWGADAEAAAMLEARRQEFAAAHDFLGLL